MSSQPQRRRLEVEKMGDVTIVFLSDRKILVVEHIQIIAEQLLNLVRNRARRTCC
jgi:hypothetical protein